MQSLAFSALATHWWLKCFDDRESSYLDHILNQAKQIAKEFEWCYSRFKSESLVFKLNSGLELVEFPMELYQILRYGEDIRIQTSGIFNLAVGGILENLGYDTDYSFRQNKSNPWKSVEGGAFEILEPNRIKLKTGYKIDLGGMGKGWLVDKIASFFQKNNFHYFSINGGGDIYATSNHGQAIDFVLENPFDSTQKIAEISIKNQGIACSSTNRRQWQDTNTKEKYHHLIDVKNHQPINSNKIAVFTQGKNSLMTDIMSTVLFLADDSQIEGLSRKFEIEYLLVFLDSSFIKSKNYSGVMYT